MPDTRHDPLPDALRDRLQATLGAGYTLERELGGGGMARVFAARDEALGRDVVVKVLAPELAAGLSAERFAREIRLAARPQHPNIVPVLGAGSLPEASGGLPYYTMPFIDGASLRARLAAGPLPVDEALPLLRDVARALAYAHARGVVHRDVKPENVLLTGGAAVVADFGVAKALSVAGGTGAGTGTLTQLGTTVGTPAYMAPEQAAGDPAVDHRADLYAWGLLAWEALVGRHPFAGRRSAHAYVVAHLTEAPPPLSVAASHVPAALAALVARCLEKDPMRRPADAAAVIALLDDDHRGRGVHASAPVASAPVAAAPPAVAVLPFVNLSSDAENEYLSDGITDEIIGTLGRARDVRVAGRASSFALKGQPLDAREVGARLGVVAVLVGSVRRVASRIRVRAELVSAADGFLLWSEQYDREIADVLAIEAEIAASIAAALRAPLTDLATPNAATANAATPRAAPPPVDPAAYELYLRGRYAWGQRTAPTSIDAVRFLAQSVERAPAFAPAWAALADAHLATPVYAGVDPAAAWPNARAAAERALALDPECAEAHTSLAYGTMLYAWDWDAAERHFARAIASNPEYATAHHWYADFLAGRGRLEEARAAMERARALDPLSRMVGVELGWILGLLRRREDALAQLDAVLRLDPNFAHAYFVRGLVRAAGGDHAGAAADARRALDLGGFHPHPFAALVHVTAAGGDRDEATRLLDALRTRAAREHVPPYCMALAYTGFGDVSEALAWLERGVRTRDELLAENFCEPLFAPVHADPRCAPIFERLGILDPPHA